MIKHIFSLAVALLLFLPKAGAWPWDDEADQLRGAMFEVRCCVNKALAKEPYQETEVDIDCGDTEPSALCESDEVEYTDFRQVYRDMDEERRCRDMAREAKEKAAACKLGNDMRRFDEISRQKDHRNYIASKYCGDLVVDTEKRREACQKEYKGGVCTQAVKVAVVRADQECY